MKNVAIGVLAVLVVWLASALVRVENERYALTLGMCWDKQLGVADWRCLAKTQTRTSPLWHVYHALTD